MYIKTKLYATKNFDNNFNKLAYIGMCILELSKALMYEFHHDYIRNSLVYEIKTEDTFEDFNSDKEMFHFSNYITSSLV